MPSSIDLKTESLQEGELLRLNEWSQFLAGIVAFFAVGLGLFLLLTSPVQGSNLNGSLRPVYGLAWIACGLMPLSRLRAGVIVERHGIIVRSRFRSTRYQWSEIKKFVFRPSLVRKCLVIELKNGDKVTADGFGIRTAADRRRAEMLVSELNRRISANP